LNLREWAFCEWLHPPKFVAPMRIQHYLLARASAIYATFDRIRFIGTTEIGRGNFGEFNRRLYIVGF
jgi:hypothetical protein